MQEKLGPQRDECCILIKAQPHRSSKYFETVCCAGVGRDQKWRRQYPVPFRILKDDQKFGRWQWISYKYVDPEIDKRRESQKLLSDTLICNDKLKRTERANFLAPLIRESFVEANERGESLTLVRPKSIRLEAIPKDASEVADEEAKHEALAAQMSMFDETAEPLRVCKMRFRVHWTDQSGKSRVHECDDWETSAAFNKFSFQYDERQAVQFLKEKYEEQYFKAGLALGFSTHSRRNVEYGMENQWLLVGLVRLNETTQQSLEF